MNLGHPQVHLKDPNEPTMQQILIYNAQILTMQGVLPVGWLLTDGRHIAQLGPGEPPDLPADISQAIDARGLTLAPGFIDLHVHGAVGHEAMDADPDGLHAMARFFAKHGVTAFLPTTWTATESDILGALRVIGRCLGPSANGACILGAHIEGPYLNASKCGAQDPALIKPADAAEALPLLESGLVRLLALAPEIPGNGWLIDACVERGVTVSAAHTAATYADMAAAVTRGVRQTTHTFNAMTPLGHREPGVVGAALTMPELACELIADNVHVHPVAMRLLVQAKGVSGVILITDAIRGAGMPDGEYPIDNRVVHVRDGAVRLPDGTLAGSTLTMDRALRNILAATGLPLSIAWPMTSLNAARAIGIAEAKGSLAAGMDADLVLLEEDATVRLTVVEGAIVYTTLGEVAR